MFFLYETIGFYFIEIILSKNNYVMLQYERKGKHKNSY